MRFLKQIGALTALGIVLASWPAWAMGSHVGTASDQLRLSVGGFDVLDDHESTEFRLEYQWAEPILWRFQPMIGLLANSDSAYYGYAGIALPYYMDRHYYVSPSFAIGGYDQGDSKDLGYGLEFKSQIEIGYTFDNNHSFGFAFSHISNASLGDGNPGTESAVLTYSIPVSMF